MKTYNVLYLSSSVIIIKHLSRTEIHIQEGFNLKTTQNFLHPLACCAAASFSLLLHHVVTFTHLGVASMWATGVIGPPPPSPPSPTIKAYTKPIFLPAGLRFANTMQRSWQRKVAIVHRACANSNDEMRTVCVWLHVLGESDEMADTSVPDTEWMGATAAHPACSIKCFALKSISR